VREDNWEIFDAIDRAQQLNKSLRPAETIVTNSEGAVVAASNPRQHPIGSTFKPESESGTRADAFSFSAGSDTAKAVRTLSYPGRVAGTIHATFNTEHLAAERREVFIALLLTNGALTAIFAVAGWLLVARMMRPVEILSRHLAVAEPTLARPVSDEIVTRTKGEFAKVFRAYNTLVRSMGEREELLKRLAEEKRLASLGRLSSVVAHEINNPLGGLFTAVSTLRSHGHIKKVREVSLGLLERGLTGIRDVVRSTLTIYRTDTTPRNFAPSDIDDLALLIGPEARRRTVNVEILNELQTTKPVPSTPVRQSMLNLLLNAVAAAPEESTVTVHAWASEAHLVIVVRDRGDGMPIGASEALSSRTDAPPPIVGGGLGLWTTNRLINDLGGWIDVVLPSDGGTEITLLLPIAHEELSNVA
jgi:signal transduction histidine kinase